MSLQTLEESDFIKHTAATTYRINNRRNKQNKNSKKRLSHQKP
jgi:hypothetical protein